MIKSLIGTLNTAQVDALIQEEELKILGYKFYYAIDADDLKHYAYPLGIFGERMVDNKLNIDYISDEQIALYTLFNKPDIRLLVFEEHYEEIKILTDIIKRSALRGSKIINSVEELITKLKNETDGNLNSLIDNSELVVSNISLLLSIAVGLQEDGIKKLYTLSNSNKLVLRDENIIDEIFENSNFMESSILDRNELTDFIYINFLERRNRKLNFNYKFNFESENFNELNRKISFTRDSNVISKVYSVNSKLYQNNVKNILLYFSSDSKTQDCFYNKTTDFDSLNKVLINSSIEIAGKNINYHRNSAQIFLRLLILESDSDSAINNLKLIKSIIQIKELQKELPDNNERIIKSKEKELDDFLSMQIDKCRREFEGYSTFLQIDKFNVLINSIKENKNDLEDKNLILKVLHNILSSKGIASNVDDWKMNVLNRINDLSQIHAFRKTIILQSIKKIDQVIFNKLRKGIIQSLGVGKDFIFGQDHHLPTFFLDDEEKVEPKFIQIVRHYDDSENSLSSYIFDLARNLFSSSNNSDELVLKRCLLLLMLSNSKSYGEDTSDYLENFLLNFNFKNSNQESNFYYLLIWILRRNGQYDSSIEFAGEAIFEFPKDPRFFHSKALCYYCKFEDSNEPKIEFLIEAYNNALKSLELYKNILGIFNLSNETKKYVQLNMYGVMNTIIYIISLGFSVSAKDFSDQMIQKARDIIDELKKIDKYFCNKSEFLHTEAHLELQEFYLKGNNSKLYYALEAIDKAIAVSSINPRVKSMCLKLRDDILNEIDKSSLI